MRVTLAGIEGISFVDFNNKLCDQEGKCMTFNEKGAIYNIYDHFSYLGVEMFINEIYNSMKD